MTDHEAFVRNALPGMFEPCLINGWVKKGGTWHKLCDLLKAGFTQAEAMAMHEGDESDPPDFRLPT